MQRVQALRTQILFKTEDSVQDQKKLLALKTQAEEIKRSAPIPIPKHTRPTYFHPSPDLLPHEILDKESNR